MQRNFEACGTLWVMPRPGAEAGRRVEAAINDFAARQHGVVTRAQLVAAGVGPDVVDRRLESGRLRSVHRGVYLVGPFGGPHVKEMAAVLACGPSAVVSHRSAAGLWQLLPVGDTPAPVEVTLRAGNRRRPGVRIRRILTLRSTEVTRIEGIPVTNPARTLYDLSSAAGPREIERALAQAFARGLARSSDVHAVLRRHAGRRGSGVLCRVLEGVDPAFTRSEAEERFLTLVRSARLDPPEVNVTIGGFEVDFLWRAERLVVEIDGFAFHSSRFAFEGDRRRDAELTAARLRVVRVTWRQLRGEPEAVLVRLARALAVQARP